MRFSWEIGQDAGALFPFKDPGEIGWADFKNAGELVDAERGIRIVLVNIGGHLSGAAWSQGGLFPGVIFAQGQRQRLKRRVELLCGRGVHDPGEG